MGAFSPFFIFEFSARPGGKSNWIPAAELIRGRWLGLIKVLIRSFMIPLCRVGLFSMNFNQTIEIGCEKSGNNEAHRADGVEFLGSAILLNFSVMVLKLSRDLF